MQIFKPNTAEEAALILREANANGTPVEFVGGGTKRDFGNLPAPVDLQISTQNLNQLVAYQPEDLTITVGAGMSFEQLQAILAQNEQWLPLDPPAMPGATIGGIVATNVNGPKRLLYGPLRDLLLGCQFVLADGRIGRSGGRVVKNVTGYDLHKLMIGSLGTLGLLTEVTFKVLPQPQTLGIVMASFDEPEQALALARRIAGSNISPATLELTNPRFNAWPNPTIIDSNFKLECMLEGPATAVKEQLAALQALGLHSEPAQTLGWISNWGNSQYFGQGADFKLKISTKLTDLPAVVTLIKQKLVQPLNLDAKIQIRAGSGIIYLYTNLEQNLFEQAARLIEEIRGEVQKMGGSLVVEKAPLPLKAKLDVFGGVGDALGAMQALKQKLDPQAILNPGRFLKGL